MTVRPGERLPAGLIDLVARIPDADLTHCLRLLAITAVDVTDLGSTPVVRSALTDWRLHGRVSDDTRTALDTLLRRIESDGFEYQRRGAIDDWRTAYLRVRTLECLRICFDNRIAPRTAVAEAAAEAAIALRSHIAVTAILSDFVARSLPV
ncbi:hypothetical protein AAFP30_19735 [Gordonia sp. CPCC 205515]|uniref:hypothetical protein n=1 Tax=Gordonia sp. CPCC 205515 TaxID=3140791 RepID=UPI003AF341E9